jgi:predicted nucleotidyltransferase
MNLLNVENAKRELAFLLKGIFGAKLNEIILFGSYAKNQADEESDVDIIVLVDEDKMQLKAYSHAVAETVTDLNLKYNVVLSVIVQSTAEYEEYKEILPFFINIRREGVPILFGE